MTQTSSFAATEAPLPLARPPRLLHTAIWMSAATIGVGAVSLSNQLVIAMVFGATRHTDAFQVGLSVPLMIMGIVTGLSTHALVPGLVRARGCPDRYAGVTGRFLVSFAGLAVLLALAGILMSSPLVSAMAPTLDADAAREATSVARVSWCNAAAVLFLSCLVAFHNASKQFLLPLVANLPAFVGMALLTAFLGHAIGVVSIPLGMLAGYGIAIPLLLRTLPHRVRFDLRSHTPLREIRDAFLQMPLVIVSMLCFTMFPTVDAIWASRLGQAQLSSLGYGQRFIVSLGTIITIGPATILLPYLVEMVDADRHALAGFGLRVVRMVVALASPLALAAVILRLPLVELLLERGAFAHATTMRVASVLPGMFAGMVPMLCAALMFKAFYACNRARSAAWTSLMGVALYFSASAILSRTFGLQGIVSAYVVTWTAMAVACLGQLSGWSWGRIATRPDIVFAAKVLCALCFEGVVTYAAWLGGGGRHHPWLTLALLSGTAGLCGLLTYGAAAYWLGIREVGLVLPRAMRARSGL